MGAKRKEAGVLVCINNAFFCQQVVPLWKLIFELISFCEFGKIDEVTARACSELSPGK